MKIYHNPPLAEWAEICRRPALDAASLGPAVNQILEEVSRFGDEAVRKFALQFDKVHLDRLDIGLAEITRLANQVEPDLKKAIDQAAANIRAFHRAQAAELEMVDILPGVRCWRKSVAIEKVGLYIPGGSAPLFSTILMLGIPAVLAGCREIILCTPPTPEGSLHPAMAYAAMVAGISRIFTVGGVQAIGAMAFGTASIPKVHKIFGPGNQYVTCAKQLVQQAGVAIDMLAGPSELAVYADQSANPAYVAADLLSQAEHGVDSQTMLVCSSDALSQAVQIELSRQLEVLPRKKIAAQALENSKTIQVDNEQTAMALLNVYAPEHLILATDRAQELAKAVINAGSVFLGHYTPESAGDYASGTNHVLPTNGYAAAYSGVSLDSFVKKISFQQISRQGLFSLGPSIERMAAAEGLQGHARAVSLRLQDFVPAIGQVRKKI